MVSKETKDWSSGNVVDVTGASVAISIPSVP